MHKENNCPKKIFWVKSFIFGDFPKIWSSFHFGEIGFLLLNVDFFGGVEEIFERVLVGEKLWIHVQFLFLGKQLKVAF